MRANVLLEYSFLIIIFNISISKGQRGCYFSILDRSRLDTCVDEWGGVITDRSQLKAGHATICTYSSCDTLRHIVCTDGSWIADVNQDDELEICDESILPTNKKKRMKRWLWGDDPTQPPPPPPPTCGWPGAVRGASVNVGTTLVGGTAIFTCDPGYEHTAGDLTRTCQSELTWSGTEPVCTYMNSCSSFPCKNEGTCTNIPESYTCTCQEIWEGTNCDQEALVCAHNPCVNHVRCEDGETIYTCICTPGWSGLICNIPVNCGEPTPGSNGDVTASHTTLGGTALYSCHKGYNATSGNKDRVCQSNGAWSGEPLVCKYAVSCQSSPCINQGTCTNLIADFHCACLQGWSGKTCDKDVHPPVVTKCPSDIQVNATEKTHLVSWTKPIFSDPMGTELLLLSNYETPSYTFPWGDFTIQYSATKVKNGLVTECVFNISVKPTPCDPLPVPKHGAILCNDWSTDYGQVCLLVCMRTYSPSPPGKLGSWMICGDDGRWSQTPSDCGMHMANASNLLVYHANYERFVYEICTDYLRFKDIFLSDMYKHPDVSEFCQLYPGCEDTSSVRVYCEE